MVQRTLGEKNMCGNNYKPKNDSEELNTAKKEVLEIPLVLSISSFYLNTRVRQLRSVSK